MLDIPIVGGSRDGEWYTPTPGRALPIGIGSLTAGGGEYWDFRHVRINGHPVGVYVLRGSSIADAATTLAKRGIGQ